MKYTKTALQVLAVIILVGGALLSMAFNGSNLEDGPSQAALQKGEGVLDGLTFATLLAPQGKPEAIQDAVFFREGQFLSLECEDRCNYPASAYYAREVERGYEFRVEAWCPTKRSTMVWRGSIIDDQLSGTVTWSVKRFYWTVGTVLEFTGELMTEEELADWLS